MVENGTGDEEDLGMKISRRSRDNVAILDLMGAAIGDDRFDLETAIRELTDEGPAGVILNLENITMMDSPGLAVIASCYVSLAKREIKLVLLNVGRSVRRLLSITKLSQVFEEYDDEDEAVEAFKEASLPG
jgi:anti-sigma B factor antagonist